MPEEPDERPAILVADDDGEVLHYLRTVLDRHGFRPLEARDGDEALRLLEAHPETEVVLLDWMMPGKDGLEVLETIRACPDAPPVLMLTARTDKRDVNKALQAGAVDYVTKPVDREALLFKINNLLGRDRVHARHAAARRKPVSMSASVSFSVVGLLPGGCVLESSFPLEEGATLFFRSMVLAKELDLPMDTRFSFRVNGCEGQGNRHRVTGSLLGLAPAVVGRLRRLAEGEDDAP